MTVRIITMATVVCDDCGCELEVDDCEARDIATARRQIEADASYDGWLVNSDADHHLCDDCAAVDAAIEGDE